MSVRVPAVVIAVLAVATLASCGDGDGSADSGKGDEARTSLTITFTGATTTRAFTLRCDPDGGTWPDATSACRGLASPAGREALAPIEIETRDLVQITDVPVTVTGTTDGRRVEVEIPRQGSGTRRARLTVLRNALGATAFAQAERDAG